jgi:hypothetical protein
MKNPRDDRQGPEIREPSRRHVLALGAAAASTVVTIKPAMAQTAASVLNCQIPVPAPEAAGSYVASDGSLVPPGTPGAVPPAMRPLTGEEATQLLRGGPALRQLHSPSAGGDERFHLLCLAADAALVR